MKVNKNRINYDPEIHDNHCKNWSDEDTAYLVQSRPNITYNELSYALGKTSEACASKYRKLKKLGLIDYYMNLDI